jgi:nicotinamidase-related amidase
MVSALSSVLDRGSAVLAVVDIQERLAAAMERRDRVIAATTLVARACGIVGVPVISTRQYPQGLGPLEPQVVSVLEELQAAGSVMGEADKVTFDCFCEPAFVAALEQTGRRQLVLVGMETHICIAQTALAAVRAGFDVHVVADGCCSRDAENHTVALDRLRAAGVVVTTSESAAYELVGRAGTPEFKALLAAVKG